jgi:hypothetical protein
MNISRSALVDSQLTDYFRKLVAEAIQKVEDTPIHRAFRLVPKQRKDRKSAQELGHRKQELEKSNQSWVYWQRNESEAPIRLMREPTNETETLAILWKLEALNALPFTHFETLAYSGKGADLVVHFQEDDNSNQERYATMEAEFRFFNYKAHEHFIPQFPTVICWDINPNPKLKPIKLPKGYKYIVSLFDTTLRIYALKEIPGIFVKTSDEMKREETSKAWRSNL